MNIFKCFKIKEATQSKDNKPVVGSILVLDTEDPFKEYFATILEIKLDNNNEWWVKYRFTHGPMTWTMKFNKFTKLYRPK